MPIELSAPVSTFPSFWTPDLIAEYNTQFAANAAAGITNYAPWWISNPEWTPTQQDYLYQFGATEVSQLPVQYQAPVSIVPVEAIVPAIVEPTTPIATPPIATPAQDYAGESYLVNAGLSVIPEGLGQVYPSPPAPTVDYLGAPGATGENGDLVALGVLGVIALGIPAVGETSYRMSKRRKVKARKVKARKVKARKVKARKVKARPRNKNGKFRKTQK